MCLPFWVVNHNCHSSLSSSNENDERAHGLLPRRLSSIKRHDLHLPAPFLVPPPPPLPSGKRHAPLVVQTVGNERMLFHGAGSHVIPQICKNGFDKRLAGSKNGQVSISFRLCIWFVLMGKSFVRVFLETEV